MIIRDRHIEVHACITPLWSREESIQTECVQCRSSVLCRRELREAVDHIIIDMLTSAHIHRHIERKLVSKHLAAAVEKQNKMLPVSVIEKYK